MSKKLKRRGAAGEGVVDTEQFAENVTPEEDDSYVVADAATGGETEQKSVEITDAHEVVEHEETGSEEDFLAQEEGSEGAEEITESREGRRGATTTVTTDEDGNTEEVEIEDDEESEDEDETEREGRSCRRGRRVRRGEAEAPESEGLIEEPVQAAPTGQGGKAPEHQTSIKSAVAFALKDRRL